MSDSLDDLAELEKMTPEVFERILKHLPEPTYVDVTLYGSFDYSEISRQAREVVPGADIQDNDVVFRLKRPSKATALEIYKSAHGINQRVEGMGESASIEEMNPRRVDILKVGWDLGSGRKMVQITLDGGGVKVSYEGIGSKPDFVAKMEQELAKIDAETRPCINVETTLSYR